MLKILRTIKYFLIFSIILGSITSYTFAKSLEDAADHIDEMQNHSSDAIMHGELGHASEAAAHAKTAITHGKAAIQTLPNDHKSSKVALPHLRDSISHLSEAVSHGEQGHANQATTHAQQGLAHAEAAALQFEAIRDR